MARGRRRGRLLRLLTEIYGAIRFISIIMRQHSLDLPRPIPALAAPPRFPSLTQRQIPEATRRRRIHLFLPRTPHAVRVTGLTAQFDVLYFTFTLADE